MCLDFATNYAHGKRIGFLSLPDNAIDTITALGELMLHIFSSLTQFASDVSFRSAPSLVWLWPRPVEAWAAASRSGRMIQGR